MVSVGLLAAAKARRLVRLFRHHLGCEDELGAVYHSLAAVVDVHFPLVPLPHPTPLPRARLEQRRGPDGRRS